MEPQLFQPTPAAVRRFACLRCRKQKKKCVVPDSTSAACDRCLRLKLDCRFKDESPPSSSSSSSSKDKPPKLTPAREDSIAAISNGNSSATPPASLNISHSSLDLYLFAAESSLLDLETCENAVEDPDLMPTVADWALVYDDMTKKGTAPPISFSLDGDYFLRTFFSQPAALRFVIPVWHNSNFTRRAG
ncbi:hypothetical protein BCR33DRAFT_850364 [Rhizoclosmatium globosum]|uniref:Zn(2)-C6 fungal-type domain-containing protein n=1 Tax=Rhizoclosmatium globosum TaxID=329046 RepID=A0A1Y2CCT6_9FUNG|nr:hypothetical protein BCR33DRAFT_850364 [Rhizoclosmatium globosum]|eukprot:ORY44871.1 hypothetical protein BCR33DRAFT_850364 [Rhizoclosmatium globosum]